MAREREVASISPAVQLFVKALVVTAKAVVLYPPVSDIPLQTAKAAEDILREVLGRDPELRLAVSKSGLLFRGKPVLSGNAAHESLSLELYRRGLAEVRFHSGAQARDVVAFLSVLKSEPEVVRASGGFESRLWERGVSAVTVTEAHFTVVNEPQEEAADPSEQPPRAQVDQALTAAYSGQSRERVVITRLLDKPATIARYLTETYSGGGSEGSAAAAQRLFELVAVAYESATDDARAELVDALAEALSEIDPEMRRTLLANHALPEARTNAAMASFVHGLDIDDVCRMLVEGAADSDISREGLARAIRVLAMVSTAQREDVIASAEAALRTEGLSDSFTSDVVERAAPTRLRSEAEGGAELSTGEEETILRFVDLAPNVRAPLSSSDDPALVTLVDEARRGITDGDVILALVDLVCIDSRDSGASPTMAALEDALEVLMERGEIDIAADAAEALRAAANEPGLQPERRRQIEDVLGRFSRPADISIVTQALRVHSQDSAEHVAAERLINALGSIAIEPVLEQLADEPDMATRKMLVGLLSRRASDHVAEFGARLTDARWYFVRNVVTILGSTRSPEVVSLLERTLRHPEPRVRRETIRALSGLRERRANAMLVSALSDGDEQNVVLAARYLGLASVEAAVPALIAVARGEGRGDRGTGARVEAIEALGSIGDPSALAALEALAGPRPIKRGGGREIRAAAQAAITRIRSSGGAT